MLGYLPGDCRSAARLHCRLRDLDGETPSDVLAVHLLLKEAGIGFAMPVAPLFETLDDLNNANDVMTQLLNIDWYRGLIQGNRW
ncbi:phosphoenolpyruvate carboxylase [Escherichia coli]|uniref:Phosphoenolpyruvate carboxylase n=1 Tax=Escherichia coli TaxID=562 RepID=A0A376TZF7_ECOLX|nr:phosphoenolpyruvate carboxylase [Escherichia coli]